MNTAEGAGRPGPGHQAGTGLSGTAEQQLVFLNTHWGRQYCFTAPTKPDGQWAATARFGPRDQIAAESATELLALVREHYQASKPAGGEAR